MDVDVVEPQLLLTSSSSSSSSSCDSARSACAASYELAAGHYSSVHGCRGCPVFARADVVAGATADAPRLRRGRRG
jgi:hypothetical protein